MSAVHDRDIRWRRKRVLIPTPQFKLGGLNGQTNTQVASTPLYGHKITTVGTPLEGIWRVPYDLDPTKPIGFRVLYTATGTTVTTTSWIVLAVFKHAQAAVADSASGALDTPIALATATIAASVLGYTARGIKNANAISKAQVFAGAFLQFSVELDAVGAGLDTSNFITLLGLEIDYARMATRFPHAEQDQPLDDAVN